MSEAPGSSAPHVYVPTFLGGKRAFFCKNKGAGRRVGRHHLRAGPAGNGEIRVGCGKRGRKILGFPHPRPSLLHPPLRLLDFPLSSPREGRKRLKNPKIHPVVLPPRAVPFGCVGPFISIYFSRMAKHRGINEVAWDAGGGSKINKNKGKNSRRDPC